MTVRDARPADFDAVTGLLTQLGRPAVDADSRAACEEVYRAQIVDSDVEHLVGVEADDVVVGFCSLHFRSRLNQSSPQAWVPDLIVTDGARGRGWGRALLEEAQRRARGRGCFSLVLESGHERRRAHGVYEAAGMTHSGRAYSLALRGRRAPR